MDLNQKKRRASLTIIKIIGPIAGLIIVLLALLLVILRPENMDWKGMGYTGAFFISLLGGSTIVVPIPTLAAVFALGGVMKYPFLVGIAAGLGETAGEMVGYMAGWGGAASFKKRNFRFYSRLEEWTRRNGALGLVVLSAIPNPFFFFTAAAAGALRYPLWKFLLSTGTGKTIKGIMVAYAGALGLAALLKLWPG